MGTGLLSVVMPTHNRPDRLERAAHSVLTQLDAELELVIVDDASSDRTPEVTDRLSSDPRVHVVRTTESVGPGAARNRGIAAASGDFLGFCDDDDAWLPGAAGILIGHLEAHPELGVVTSWHRVIQDHSGRTDYTADEMLWFNFVALPFGIIRRSHFVDDLSFDESLPPCEDWDLWLRCAQHRPVHTVPHVLYDYHQHGGDRVTKEGSGDRGGRQAFFDKHASEMTASCRIYHRAAIAHQTAGRVAMLKELASDLASPVAAAFAASVLSASKATATLGIRRRDPGLSSRAMHRLLTMGTGQHRNGRPKS
jgi:hypothetical protein